MDEKLPMQRCQSGLLEYPGSEEDFAVGSSSESNDDDHFVPLVAEKFCAVDHDHCSDDEESLSRCLQQSGGRFNHSTLKARQLALLHGDSFWVRRSPIRFGLLMVLAVLVAAAMVVVTTTTHRVQSSEPMTSSLVIAPHRPPLEELIGQDPNQNSKLTIKAGSDVQWLLDFAIIGHSKCATTIQQRWLYHHPEILVYDEEIHSLSQGKPAELVKLMYALPEGNDKKRGYKAPNDIRLDPALTALHTYFPKTKLIVGVRHPVKWFESYYNYHARKAKEGSKPPLDLPPELMVGPFLPDHVKFHQHLSKLGKTSMVDPIENELLGMDNPLPGSSRMENPIFLYEVSQPFDTTNDRHVQYRQDLQEYLELHAPLPPIWARNSSESSRNYHYVMDICDDKFRHLRSELLEVGRVASAWILQFFLVQPDVVVSSPDLFQELLQSWSKDTCV